jgi:membrane protein DedA with SNARE-associated domain
VHCNNFREARWLAKIKAAASAGCLGGATPALLRRGGGWANQARADEGRDGAPLPLAPPGACAIPTDLPSFLDLIRQHGDAAYSLMFGYAASHSLLFALFGGFAAHAGAFHLPALIAVCWLGSFLGDVVRFWIGRRYGTRWLKRFPRLERYVMVATRLANRHYLWMILIHRYPHGIRGVAGFAYGMSQVPWPTFLALNFVAAGLWAVGLVSVGFAFGQVSEKMMTDASSQLGVATLVGFLALSWFLSKRLERIMEENEKAVAEAERAKMKKPALKKAGRKRRHART